MAAALRTPTRAVARALPNGRLHLQDGPIDIVLEAWADERNVTSAYEAVVARFSTILDELVGELRELRRPIAENPRLSSPVALRMARACRPFADDFITPMAAVAGAVADELLDAMRAAAPLDRAFVNNGGDIAVHATSAHALSIGLVSDIGRALSGALEGSIRIGAGSGIGGVATSGWQGRSFSLGIADAVTVLAADAASADAAATMIANAVNIDSEKIRRAPARSLDPDSDLGDRLVTVDVSALSDCEIEEALVRGAERAQEIQARGLIIGAALMLKERVQVLDVGAQRTQAVIPEAAKAAVRDPPRRYDMGARFALARAPE